MLYVATPPGKESVVPVVPVLAGNEASQVGDTRDVVGPKV